MAIYFDNAATTKPSAAAVAAFTEALSLYGNPSSPHALGAEARRRLETARATLASLVGCKTEEFYFTASGTESDNSAIYGLWELRKRYGKRVILTDSEHPAVKEPCRRLEAQGAEVVYLPTRGGVIDTEFLKEAIKTPTALVCVMLANNETGAVYDIKAVRDIINAANSRALLHCDAVQGFMKAEGYKQALRQADSAAFSAHKLHGLRGVGGLMLKSNLHPPAFVVGGGQEKGMRSGTENLAAAVAFAAAATEYGKGAIEKVKEIRAYTEEKLRALDNIGFNVPPKHLEGILNISLRGIKSETALNCLSTQEIYISASSACSSKQAENTVLAAYGLEKADRECALRIGISPLNTKEEADALVAALEGARQRYGRI